MNYLSAENISKNYGEKILFESLSFGLSKGDKTALIANNGTGKSTLLKILVGKDVSDTGKVAIRDGVRIGYLDQEPEFDEALTIKELMNTSHSDMLRVIRAYEKALDDQTENYNDATHKAFEKASAAMERYQTWDYERQMEEILSRFGITNLEQNIGDLSGGQKKRLALAMVLLDHPDLLILDEPTNHLDIDMVEWLENYLIQSNFTLLMVTHDRYFLERVCDHILELSDGKLYHHVGNYSYFLEKRAEREEVERTEIDKAGKLMKQELEWMRRMPKARGTKSKSRIDAFYATEEKAKSGKIQDELKLEVKMSRIGGKILELKKLRKSYDDTLILDGFSYTFKKGERIGIIGKNGVGKSTFLNIITGIEQADSGKVNAGETIIFGYYSQKGIRLNEDKRVIEVLRDIADVIEMSNGTKLSATQLLQQFMFSPEMQYTHVSKLSGGERRRLYLLTVLIKNPNFLILDEPTNDLDLLTLNKLEEFLTAFGGCLMVVTHDRYFMDKLVDHLFVFEGDGEIRDFNGKYTEYRNEKEWEEKQEKINKTVEKAAPAQQPPAEKPTEKKKLSFKEQREYETLEKEIAALEKEKQELEAALGEGNSDFEALQKLSNRVSEVIGLIDEKTLRWMELDELS